MKEGGPSCVDCSPEALSRLTAAFCPVRPRSLAAAALALVHVSHPGPPQSGSADRVVPFSCPVACASPFVTWWNACGAVDVTLALDDVLNGLLSHFARACGRISRGMPGVGVACDCGADPSLCH